MQMLGKFGGNTKLMFYIFLPLLFKIRSRVTALPRLKYPFIMRFDSFFYPTSHRIIYLLH